MPQKSYVYATGSVRVLEGQMLSNERVERMLTASSPMEAIRTLQEAGYGRGEDVQSPHDYEGWIARKAEQLYSYIRMYTPEQGSTDGFLTRMDYKNAQALYKAKHLTEETELPLSSGGLIDPEVLSACIREQDYSRLPGEMQAALKKLDAQAASSTSPREIDVELDKALFLHIQSLMKKMKSKLVKQYFVDLADLTNLRSVLRARVMQLSSEQLKEQLVTGGEVGMEALLSIRDEPERALVAFSAKGYRRELEDTIAAYQQGEGLGKLERLMDNHLLATIRKGQWNMNSVEPTVGYLLGMEREMAAIRLIMVGLINGFPQESIRERLGDLYV